MLWALDDELVDGIPPFRLAHYVGLALRQEGTVPMTEMIPTTGHATKRKTTFRMTYAVGANIKAPTSRIWALLTDAQALPPMEYNGATH